MKKHVVSFSGGRTSAYLVYLICSMAKKHGWDVEFVFMDTGAEHPKTYDFIKKCAEYFGVEITVLNTVITQQMGIGPKFKHGHIDEIKWDLSVFNDLTKKYGNPYNPGGGFCTDKLKTVTFEKYIQEKKRLYKYYAGIDLDVTTWIGIRIDEKRRLKDKPNVKYLAEISQMDKEDIISWWSEMPFDLEIPEWLGNCVFCIKKNPNKIALAIKQEPVLAKEWADSLMDSRVLKEDVPVDAIYRGKLSMDGIAMLYENITEQEIINNLRGSKRTDSGCGSESCEVFGQMDMFKEVVEA